MFARVSMVVAVLAGFAACTPDEPTSQAPAAASFATKPGFDRSRILGTDVVTIVTSTPAQRGLVSWDKPVEGSRCSADSAEISASFVTPAKVALPVIKGKPSPLTITCTNGAQSGTIRTTPLLIESNESGNLALDQDNIVAGVIFGAIAAGQERREARARDAWRYVEVSAGISIR